MRVTYIKAWYGYVYVLMAFGCPYWICNECEWMVPGTENEEEWE